MSNAARVGRRLTAAPTSAAPSPLDERYLSVAEFAQLLGTTDRFPRRLVAERRIRYVKFGTHVRFPESVVREFIVTNTVEPVQPRRRARRAA